LKNKIELANNPSPAAPKKGPAFRAFSFPTALACPEPEVVWGQGFF